MYHNIYDKIIVNANFGYIYCRIIYNAKSHPIDLEIVKSNNAFVKLFNLAYQNIVGLKFSALFPSFFNSDFQCVKLYCNTAQNPKNNDLNQFFDSINKDLNVQPIIHDNDYISLIFTDVPCHHTNIEKSDNQTEYLKQIIDNSEDTVLLQDSEGKILFYSDSEKYGIQEEMITGRSLFDFFDKKLASVQLSRVKSVFESGLRTYFESNGSWTGTSAHFLDQYNPVFNTSGKVEAVAVISRNITKLKIAEQALKKSEEKFRFIIKNITDSISTLNPEGVQTFVSSSAEKITGYSIAELKGKSMAELVHPDDLPNILENWQRIIDNPSETITIKYRHKHKTKQWIHVEAIAKNLLNNSVINSVLLIARDVTERESAIQKIDCQNRLLNTILDNIPIGVYMVEVPSGKPLISNKAALGIFGGEITKETLMKVYKTETKLKYPIQNLPIMKGKKGIKSRIDDIDIVRPDGATIQLEIYGTPVLDANNNVIMSLVSFMDITGKNLIQKALKNSEYNFRMLFDNIDNLLIIIDHESKIIRVNNSVKRILKFSNKDLHGKNICLLYGEKDQDRVLEIIDLISHDQEKEFPFSLKAKTGEIIPVETNITKGYWDGNPALYVMCRDISKIKQYSEELKQVVADKDRFMQIIAHDLKNPFNVLIGFSEVLKHSIYESDINKSIMYIDYINQTANKTFSLLNDLLLWANSQTGKLPFEPENIQLSTICNKVIQSCEMQLKQKEITASYFGSEAFYINADKNMTITILTNLISNSIKFSQKKQHINIYSRVKKGMVAISVADSGIGISPENQKKLWDFTKPFTTSGTEKETGTGLGLLLCKEFVEKHGGTIWVESNEGKGCEFTFTLPLAKQR